MTSTGDDPRAPVRLEDLTGDGDGRKYSPSAGRNRADIVDALRDELPATGDLLEVAAGTGEHAVLAAERLPGWNWWPTDRDPEALASMRAWAASVRLPNLKMPAPLDLHGAWPLEGRGLDAVFASNLLHIAPIETADRLFEGAARHLRPGGCLLVYGAFFLPGTAPAPSNLQFDQELRAKDPRYGVRSLADLLERPSAQQLLPPKVRGMPNNNFLLRFEQKSS